MIYYWLVETKRMLDERGGNYSVLISKERLEALIKFIDEMMEQVDRAEFEKKGLN